MAKQAEKDDTPGCTIKALPAKLRERAAELAIEHNPANGLGLGLATIPGGPPIPRAKLTLLVAKYWGPVPRQLTVSFLDNPSVVLRERVLGHMNAWAKTGCVEFVDSPRSPGQVRVSFGRGGYWSYLGTDVLLIPQNEPTMNLQGFSMDTPGSEFTRVIRHETGHTLGFPHEHMRRELIQRLDRQKTYSYFQRTQGWDRRTVDAQVLTPLHERSIRGTASADQDSIMCYQLPASITKDRRPIRGGGDIDAADYEFCGRLYPRAR